TGNDGRISAGGGRGHRNDEVPTEHRTEGPRRGADTAGRLDAGAPAVDLHVRALDQAQDGAAGRRDASLMDGITHGTVTANSLRIHYVEAGDGSLVVLPRDGVSKARKYSRATRQA